MKITWRNLLLTFSGFSVFSLITMGEAKPAHAWFDVCNQSTQTVDVAFAHIDGYWTSRGWWTLSSGQCARVYPHELRKRNSYYYVHARGHSGSVWTGKHNFCVTNSAFTLGNANTRCGGNGRWESFKEVYTGNSRNFTYKLTE